MSTVAILTAAIILIPQTASAQNCTATPSGTMCSCLADPSCGANSIPAQNISTKGTKTPIFGGTTCTAGTPCLIREDALCQKVLDGYAAGTSASCKTSCSDKKLAAINLMNTLEPCSFGKVCCAEAAVAPTTGGCINLPGITSTCKTAVGSGDVDLNKSSSYWSPLLAGYSCTGSCTAPAGSELCAAVAKHDKLSGTYVCAMNLSDCQTALNNDVSAYVCGTQGTCCIAKPNSATAGGSGTGAGVAGTAKTLPDPLGGVNIPTFIGNIIKTFAGIAGTIALVMFVYGGIMLIMSGGEQKKVADGQKILVNASIGLLLIFSAYTFVTAIISAILAE